MDNYTGELATPPPPARNKSRGSRPLGLGPVKNLPLQTEMQSWYFKSCVCQDRCSQRTPAVLAVVRETKYLKMWSTVSGYRSRNDQTKSRPHAAVF